MLTHFSITQQGARHIQSGAPCQDYSDSVRIHPEHLETDYVLAAIADGVGSCQFSQIGSKTAVRSLLQFLEKDMSAPGFQPTDNTMSKLLLDGLRYALEQVEQAADEKELPFLQLDSTLTGAVYDGKNLWFCHIGDDGIVALYTDGTYEMVTTRHKGQEAHSLYPLRFEEKWQVGKAEKNVASLALMTDGVLDDCVADEKLDNMVCFNRLRPALTEPMSSDESSAELKKEWENYLWMSEGYEEKFRSRVSDDITLVVVQNPELVAALPEIHFDVNLWNTRVLQAQAEADKQLKEMQQARLAEQARQRARSQEQRSPSFRGGRNRQNVYDWQTDAEMRRDGTPAGLSGQPAAPTRLPTREQPVEKAPPAPPAGGQRTQAGSASTAAPRPPRGIRSRFDGKRSKTEPPGQDSRAIPPQDPYDSEFEPLSVDVYRSTPSGLRKEPLARALEEAGSALIVSAAKAGHILREGMSQAIDSFAQEMQSAEDVPAPHENLSDSSELLPTSSEEPSGPVDGTP